MTYTHTEKLMYPESGITKGDVLDFYRRMAPRLLPYLRDRPATLERLPEGLEGSDAPHFWQKRTPDYYPEWIERVELPSERRRGGTIRAGQRRGDVAVPRQPGHAHVPCGVFTARRPGPARFCACLISILGRPVLADAVAVAKSLAQALAGRGPQGFREDVGQDRAARTRALGEAGRV